MRHLALSLSPLLLSLVYSIAVDILPVEIGNIELSHWYKVDKVFYTPEAKLRCVKITSYITKRS